MTSDISRIKCAWSNLFLPITNKSLVSSQKEYLALIQPSSFLLHNVHIFAPLEAETGPARGVSAELHPVRQGLGEGLAGGLGQEERGQGSDGRAETEYEER